MLFRSGMVLPGPTTTNDTAQEIIELDTHEFRISDQPQTPPADVLLALSRYEGALAELRQAALRPQSRFPISFLANDPWDIRLPHLSDLKKCAQVLQLRAIAELQAGQGEQALADVKLMLRLAEAIRTDPVMISYPVRQSIIVMAIQPIWEGLADRQWSETEMKEINRTLRPLDLIADWQACLRAERASVIGTIEHFRKHRDETAILLIVSICPQSLEMLDGLGHVLPNLPVSITQYFDPLMQYLPGESIGHMMIKLPPDGWYELNKVSLAKLYQEQMFQIADVEKHRMSRQKVVDIMSVFDQERGSLRRFGPQDVFSSLLIPGTTILAQRVAISQNSVDMASVACALECYHLIHGSYPQSLAALAPEFIPTILPDVVSGEPLCYRPTDDGRFTLYSVGWNGKDDGGVIGTNQSGRLDPQSGDWVWQYPAE